MGEITLESLIEEQENRLKRLKSNHEKPYQSYSYNAVDNREYLEWVERVQRYLELHFPHDKHIKVFEELSDQYISEYQQNKLLAILKAFREQPATIPMNKTDHKTPKQPNIIANINNINSQSQTQEQVQSITVELFLTAIKDELTGKQVKELESIVREANNEPEKARPKIIAKLLSFGSDVLANIVANLITNLSIWR